MFLDFEQFKAAADVVENIIYKVNIENIEGEIRNSSSKIPIEKKREFYRHMNSLFLNVLLNRLDSTPSGTEKKVIESRRVIVNILNSL